ncbi:MAG: hypothetical protein GX430_07205 [Treponema sp.]|nr:hypothetical protein [Treponema sp.]
MSGSRPRPPKDITFALAIALVLVGTALLLLTTGALPGPSRLWPMGVAAVGCVILYLGATRSLPSAWIFVGSAFVLSAALLIVRGFMEWPLSRYWPLFMVVLGCSNLVSGWIRYKRRRAAYLVPSIAFMILGVFFSLFSFDVIQFSFRRFFSEWWPVFLIAAGLVLLFLYFYNRIRFARASGRTER